MFRLTKTESWSSSGSYQNSLEPPSRFGGIEMNTLVGMPEPSVDNAVEPTPAQLWSDRWLWPVGQILLIIAIVATAVTVALWTQRDTAVRLGSMPERIESSVRVDKRGDFTYGMMYIDEPGKDVRIVSLTPLTSSNVQFLGASTIWPRTTPYGMQGRGPGFPMKGAIELHPAADVIPASETSYIEGPSRGTPDSITVLAGFRLLSGDIGAFNGVQLTYTAGGKTVRKVYDYAALLCHEQRHCEAPEGTGFYRWSEQVLRDFGLVY